ncbi:phage minor capsid protein [Cytobacillus firmus]|nr:phage minor capsid protein [Cytobacillus firmus]
MYEAPPRPNYDKDINRLIAYYQRAYKQILQLLLDMKNNGTSSDIYQRQASVLRQIEVILTQLNEDNKVWCQTMIYQAFFDGQASALLTAGGAATLADAVRDVKFSMLSQGVVDSLINDTYSDLLKATTNTSKQVRQLVQSVVSDVMRMGSLNNTGRVQMTREIRQGLTNKALEQKLEKDGFIGIIDKRKRPWSTKRYADMIARTKLNQAHVEGVRVSGIERGIDLAVISTHNAPDECSLFEGMIISLNGLTDGLLSYQEIYDSNKCFHPNCQHKVHLIKPELLPKAVKDKHDRKAKAMSLDSFRGKIKPIDKIKTANKDEVKAYSEQLSLAL